MLGALSASALNAMALNDGVPLWFQANFARQQQKPAEDAIYAAFGRFIAAYSLAEAGIHIAARFFSGATEARARLIFGGMRLADVIHRLKAFVEGTDCAAEIEALVGQINTIGDARDQFVHRLIEYTHGQGLTVTNRLTSKVEEQPNLRTFTVTELTDMAQDCRAIFGRLIMMCERNDLSGVGGDISVLGLYAPWRYIPPPPANPKKRGRASRKESRRPRGASRLSRSDH